MRENWGKHQGRARRQLMLSKNHCFVYCIKSALTKKTKPKQKTPKQPTNQRKTANLQQMSGVTVEI